MAMNFSIHNIAKVSVKDTNFSGKGTTSGRGFVHQKWTLTDKDGQSFEMNLYAEKSGDLSINFEGTENV